jgi:ABC-2 type transport system ATP-binding protein
MAKIELAGLSGVSKHYHDVVAVEDLTLSVEAGDVLKLLGPNGAGKTTTMRLVMGFARPTRGTILFDGAPLTPHLLERISFVPETSALFERLTGADHIEWHRRSFRHFNMTIARKLSERFSLDWRKRVRELSKGQRTALSLVLAFSTEPEILVLDEPTSGLDPINQQVLHDLLIDAANRGAAVMLSSHHIREFESIANRVAILQKGRLTVSGTIDDLKAQFRLIDVSLPPGGSENGLRADARVLSMRRNERLLRVVVRCADDAIERELAVLGSIVRVKNLSLEEIFLEAVGTHELR